MMLISFTSLLIFKWTLVVNINGGKVKVFCFFIKFWIFEGKTFLWIALLGIKTYLWLLTKCLIKSSFVLKKIYLAFPPSIYLYIFENRYLYCNFWTKNRFIMKSIISIIRVSKKKNRWMRHTPLVNPSSNRPKKPIVNPCLIGIVCFLLSQITRNNN